jgi:hypothetical protein
LQVLFGEKRDDVRHELLRCGYSKEEIEKQFIPVMTLRAEFDVGHASLAILKQDQLDALYRFLNNAEPYFRELLKRVFEKTKNKNYSPKSDPDDLYLKKEKLKTMNSLRAVFEQS